MKLTFRYIIKTLTTGVAVGLVTGFLLPVVTEGMSATLHWWIVFGVSFLVSIRMIIKRVGTSKFRATK